ncbi:uncharacterized protein Dana_GF23456 [Drosophila ananassae]|uniref:Uncharacterized protein n=1 Tax=Drosophila ananassae TaxID=7217 RepID=B3MB68_DROAN|nr:uncharacterized protein LOC6506097 [Drosophila ananassae]EDV41369.1 uncharacterized protein Dana_GF23456 [Drosophila ananassae]
MREVLTRSVCGMCLMLVIFVPLSGAWRSFKVILTSVDFEVNDKFVDVKAKLQNDTGDAKLTLDIMVLEDIDDVEMAIDVALETEKGNYSTLITRSINFCKLMKQRNTDPLMRLIYDDLLKHGSFFKECPIRRGPFSLTGYKVDEEALPSFLPESKFRFGLHILKPKKETIVRGTIFGRVDKSKGFDNLKRFSLG